MSGYHNNGICTLCPWCQRHAWPSQVNLTFAMHMTPAVKAKTSCLTILYMYYNYYSYKIYKSRSTTSLDVELEPAEVDSRRLVWAGGSGIREQSRKAARRGDMHPVHMHAARISRAQRCNKESAHLYFVVDLSTLVRTVHVPHLVHQVQKAAGLRLRCSPAQKFKTM